MAGRRDAWHTEERASQHAMAMAVALSLVWWASVPGVASADGVANPQEVREATAQEQAKERQSAGTETPDPDAEEAARAEPDAAEPAEEAEEQESTPSTTAADSDPVQESSSPTEAYDEATADDAGTAAPATRSEQGDSQSGDAQESVGQLADEDAANPDAQDMPEDDGAFSLAGIAQRVMRVAQTQTEGFVAASVGAAALVLSAIILAIRDRHYAATATSYHRRRHFAF